jgi:hypothetical protein
MNTWAEDELRTVQFGDQRLSRRLLHLVDALAAHPAASVPQALGPWAAVKGAYRFWDNERVTPDAIRAAHQQRTRERLPATGPLLALQDTTTLDFTAHPATRALGYLGDLKHAGLCVHSVLVADTHGVPLGVLHQEVWTRDPADFGKRRQRRFKDTADKESQRWLTALEATAQALPADRTVITVADREADFYDLFAAPRRPDLHLLIRAKGRRRVHHEAGLLGAALQSRPVQGSLGVTVPRHGERPARQAVLTLRFGTFLLAVPSTHPRRRQLPALPLQGVLAEEAAPPPGEKPVRWLLLTTLALPDAAAAAQVVRWYAARWLIERYHYALKSGCRIEDLQLESAARLQRALATYSVVAWRLLWLTYESRQHPETPCDAVLSREQWQVLYRRNHPQTPLPAVAPGLRQAVQWIARLGGFLARRHDGEPGIKTIWRGLRRLDDLVAGYQLAFPHNQAAPDMGNA